jgi:hypothetical protein
VAIRATRGPNHHYETPAEEPVSLEALLTIVLAVVQQCQGWAGEHDFGVPEIQSPSAIVF